MVPSKGPNIQKIRMIGNVNTLNFSCHMFCLLPKFHMHSLFVHLPVKKILRLRDAKLNDAHLNSLIPAVRPLLKHAVAFSVIAESVTWNICSNVEVM